MPRARKGKPAEPAYLPAHQVKDLPAPPPFTFKNVIRVIGPGAILLGTSIGSGEWLLGPATIVQYGAALLWITTVAVILQVFLNVEFVRYTMYTGEPIITGFMRTKPGPKLWGWLYSIFIFAQYLWPGWAAAAASTLFAAFMGRIPGAGDRQLMLMFGYLTFFLCVLVVIFGGKIERMLEYASWFMVAWIFLFLIVANIIFVPASSSAHTFSGFFKFGALPAGADWLLLGAFAAYSGAGGMGNCFISNWMRDKGYGMGSTVGYIPSAVGGKAVKLSHIGNIFEINAKNLSRWRIWMKYLAVDQYVVWGLGCMLGMYLCVNLAAAIVPAGTRMTGLATGAYQAK
ncbi:MAG: Nramp family divalent metal transporter, partial [candidate division NC10 bacterium]|nr:Nramp family divalent metal transporter [candidate division NC10 bacterium]